MTLQELVLEWRLQFAVTQSYGNALCCVLCLIHSLDPLLVFVVWCAWHWYLSWRGAVCHRVTAPHLGTFCLPLGPPKTHNKGKVVSGYYGKV